ncbi:MAG: MarR family winged helix-turn-helix transcriptional regulator [Rhodospirillales bacterium]
MPRRRRDSVPPLMLDRFIPYRLSVLAARVSQRLAREYEQAVGLQLPEARVMTVLGSFSPVSSNAVVQHTSMDKATVSRAIVRLFHLGLVTRTPDPRDRRLLILSFTPKGRRAYTKLTHAARRWESWFVEGMSRADRAGLVRMLARLGERLGSGRTGNRQPAGPASRF